MLFSFALIFIVGFILSSLFNKIKLPGILGMLITGVVLGPFVLDKISPDILNISSDLRQIALIVILMRAGLSLDINNLKKVGRPAILMCFIPALFEIIGVIILAPLVFGISYIEAAIMGTVLAAVSPAVIVPRMIKVMESGYGRGKNIPEIILAGASVDDIFVIILFTSFMEMYGGSGFNLLSLLSVPISIGIGLGLGVLIGVLVVKVFKVIDMRNTMKVIIMLSLAFLLVSLEKAIEAYIPMSGLLAVMSLGGTILKKDVILAEILSQKLSKIWVVAEILLFVLVGAAVDIRYMIGAGIIGVIFILTSLIFRTFGVYLSLLKTRLNKGEKIFCMISYLPKATVQAAIGSIPLVNGVESGNLILTMAVLAIFVTAPIGAIGVDLSYKKLLIKK